MYNRYDDTNWGKHGNPYRREWYHFARSRRELPLAFNFTDIEQTDFEGPETRISLWTIFWVIAIIFILSGFSETARGVVFYGIDLTETWYHSVDSLLDTLGAPKLP